MSKNKLSEEDIKVGETYNVRVKVEHIDEDGWIKVRTSEQAISFMLSPREQDAFSSLPKYDPCRRFREGDKVRPVERYGRMPDDGALPVLHEEYGGIYGLQYLSIHEARERVLRAINALTDEDIDKDGNPYDMVTEYEPRILRQIERCKRVSSESPYHKTREKARKRAIFYQDICKRALGYWAPTERNARRALVNLLQLLCMAPDNAKIEIN